MKLGLSHLAVSLILLRHFGSAAASSNHPRNADGDFSAGLNDAGAPTRPTNGEYNSDTELEDPRSQIEEIVNIFSTRLGLGNLVVVNSLLFNDSESSDESDTSSDLLASDEEPHISTEMTTKELRLRLKAKKKEIVDAIGDVSLEFGYFSVCKYVKDQRREFVELLLKSKLYPSIFFKKAHRNEIFAMAADDFKKDCNSRYASNENIKRFLAYKRKIEEYAAEEGDLASKIREEAEKAPRTGASLEALEDLLDRCRTRRYRLEAKLGGEFGKCCRFMKKHHAKINEFRLKNIMGASAISVLYNSYLADKRHLKEREHAEEASEKRQGPSCEAVSSLPGEPMLCTVCGDLLKPGECIVSCENHGFHGGCLHRWGKNERRCPVCRKEFTPEQEKTLEEIKKMKPVPKIHDDPALEERYMCGSRPIREGRDAGDFLEAVHRRIRRRFLRFRSHPHYFEIFDNYEEYPELYIPRNIADYFTGYRDPRSRGFSGYKAAVIECMLPYLDIENTRGNAMCEGINRLFHSLFDAFCATGCLVEHLHTRLCEIEGFNGKKSAAQSSPVTYPAICSLVKGRKHFSGKRLKDAFDAFGDVVDNDITIRTQFYDRRRWGKKFLSFSTLQPEPQVLAPESVFLCRAAPQ